MGPLTTEACSLPLQALRSFRVRKLQYVTPAEFQSFYTKLWFSASEIMKLLVLDCAQAARAHTFALVRKYAKHAQGALLIPVEKGI